ncbi:MAG: IS1634 family transposase [Gammaproteobacteria bacterium]
MIIQLRGQAQELLGKTELVVITERVDDVALLLAQMMHMGLPEILDQHLPRHWKQTGLSWGWTAVIWLAYILSEGDHRKVAMETYVRGMRYTLEQITAQTLRVLDFSDDRLAHLLKHLSKAKYWHPIEQALNEHSMTLYDLSAEVIRCDATTVSADHEVVEGGLVQFGHSKDDPSRPQIKLMTASLDPLGLPLATTVVSGEQADDGLYIPLLERLGKGFQKPGLLVVGDGTMSALDIRAYLSKRQQLYLSPLPLTGTTAQQMPQWISQGIAKDRAGKLERVFRTDDQGQEVRVAQGYELERTCRVQETSGPREWPERVLVVHSPAHGERQGKGLDKRLAQAETKIRALTPVRGRGKRQITAEAELVKAISRVLKAHRVEGFLQIAYVKQTECRTQYVGRGRGSVEREQRVIEKVRYQITDLTRDEERIGDLKAQFGWKAFVTNATAARLSLADAVLCYRHEYRIERIFNRLKSRLHIAPMFVSREDQIQGLTYLLTLGVRVLTVMEFTLRRSLQKDQATLPGLHPENRNKGSDKPTAERVLKAFSKVTLTIIKDTAGREVGRWLTPLSSVQQDILRRLGLEASLYQQLEILNTRK